MLCKVCGNRVNDDAEACDYCGSRVEKEAPKKRSVNKWVLIAILAISAVGLGIGVFGKNGTGGIDKQKHDKSHVMTGNYEGVKNHFEVLGYAVMDEKTLSVDFDKDGEKEELYFYIDGNSVYIDLNGENVYSGTNRSSNGYTDDYLIVLPIGDNMFGAIITGCDSTYSYFSKMLCFYNDEVSDSFTYRYESVAHGTLHVNYIDGEYAVYTGYGDPRQVFRDGQIYTTMSY